MSYQYRSSQRRAAATNRAIAALEADELRCASFGYTVEYAGNGLWEIGLRHADLPLRDAPDTLYRSRRAAFDAILNVLP